MKAAIIYGPSTAPQYGVFKDPASEPAEVLIKVSAVVAQCEIRTDADSSDEVRYPFVPGTNGVGRIDGGKGRRVFFAWPQMPFGSMAEWSRVPWKNCVEVPDGLDDIPAAAIGALGMSVWAALLRRAEFQPGESVLIHGASGAEGRLAVQIAKALGAGFVLVTCRNKEYAAQLSQLGADVVMTLDLPGRQITKAIEVEIARAEISVVLDYLWGTSAEQLLGVLSQLGDFSGTATIRYVQLASRAGSTINLDASSFDNSRLKLLGCGPGSVSRAEFIKAVADLMRMAASTRIQVNPDVRPLADVSSAWNTHQVRPIVFTV